MQILRFQFKTLLFQYKCYCFTPNVNFSAYVFSPKLYFFSANPTYIRSKMLLLLSNSYVFSRKVNLFSPNFTFSIQKVTFSVQIVLFSANPSASVQHLTFFFSANPSFVVQNFTFSVQKLTFTVQIVFAPPSRLKLTKVTMTVCLAIEKRCRFWIESFSVNTPYRYQFLCIKKHLSV